MSEFLRPEKYAVGVRVRLKHEVDRYPHFCAPKGGTGVIVYAGEDSGLIAVRLDEHLPGAEEWENEVHWYLPNGDDPDFDLELLLTDEDIVRERGAKDTGERLTVEELAKEVGVVTTWGGDLEEVRLDSDEGGWELVVETNSGTYRFDAQGVAMGGMLATQLRKVVKELDDWWEEGVAAARSWERERPVSPEESGYDLDDPKSPGYHDRMVGDA